MGSINSRLTTISSDMLKLVLLLSVASLGSALNCQECVNEMHGLSFLVKQASPDIQAFLTANYCPGLEGHEEQCENDLTRNFCPVPEESPVPEPFPFTCEECVEGLEVVGAYMTDPLWIAEYTLYLEQNFCVGHPDRCVEAVKTHFPPMHAMTVEAFWKPQDICNSVSAACGATKPPQ